MNDHRIRDEDYDDSMPPFDGPPRRPRGDRYSSVRESAQDAVRRASGRSRRPPAGGGLSSLSKRPRVLLLALVGALAVLAIVLYSLLSRPSQPTQSVTQTPAAQQQPRPAAPAPETTTQPVQPPAPTGKESFLESLMGGESQPESQANDEGWLAAGARIILKLALAALLAALLAFRPRKDVPAVNRNPYVGQTQILLAVVAAALMMVVADNAARAFGIFAAASLVRFRTNIRDPKEITVLLVSLALGLASGVGRMEVAILLTLFVMLMLYVLEYYEPAQVFRSLELTVTTRNVSETDEALKELFEKYDFTAELREVDRQDPEDPIGKIVYYVNVSPRVSTDELSEELFSYDRENIDSIQWDQKKSTSYIYR